MRYRRVVNDIDDKIAARAAVAICISHRHRKGRVRATQRVVEERVTVGDRALASSRAPGVRGGEPACRIGECPLYAGDVENESTQLNLQHAIRRSKADRPDFGGDWKRCLAGM
jgi:hypothetical protein